MWIWCDCLCAMCVLSGGFCVCVYMSVCMCVTCVRMNVCSIEWKLRVGLVQSGCCICCQQPVETLRLSSDALCLWVNHMNLVNAFVMYMSGGLCVCVCVWSRYMHVCSFEWKPWEGLVLSGCCVRCQQPVEMLRLLSGAPCFMSDSREFGEYHCLFAMYVLSGLCVCVCVCVALSGSLERVLCCLDVASVVSSLSRFCIFCQVPRVLWVIHMNLVNPSLICYVCIEWWTLCVCEVDVYVCM